MAKLVVNNSQMQCSQGTDISAINISSQNIVAIAGEFVATEEDKIGVGNIPSFGVCKCSSPESSLYSPATRLAANNKERQYQWDEEADGAVILYVCQGR